MRFIITACTVMQEVVKTNSKVNGKGQISTPCGSETPERISMKPRIYNYFAGTTTLATCKSMRSCDNVGGLGDHVTCHMFWYRRPFLLYSSPRAQPSTGGRILTIYTSYDVFPPKEVPFGGADDICLLYTSPSPRDS